MHRFFKYPNGFKFADPARTRIDLNSNEVRGEPLETEWIRAFPTLKDLAELSNHVYSIHELPYNQVLPFEITKISEDGLECRIHGVKCKIEEGMCKMMDGWECIATAVLTDTDGYCGAAYLNKNLSQIVIAHKGTGSWKDLVTDWNGVVLNRNVPQISSAYIFTKLVVNQFHDEKATISITGHSLGGWLAQICTLYVECSELITDNDNEKKFIDEKEADLTSQSTSIDSIVGQLTKQQYERYHLHAVAFDSPGCRSALRRIIGGRYNTDKNIEYSVKIKSLDITVVIAPSNLINTHGEHVGYVIHLPIQGVPIVSQNTESHGIKHVIQYLSPEVFPLVVEVYDAQRWRPVEGRRHGVIHNYWYIGHTNYCRPNIFSFQEQEFLNSAQTLTKWKKTRVDKTASANEVHIFQDDINAETHAILERLDAAFPNHFICGLKIEHEIMSVEFPDMIGTSSDSDRERMGKLIWKLKKLFKEYPKWLTVQENMDDTALANTIKSLPTCVESICKNVESEYLQLIPELCIDSPEGSMIKSFLENPVQLQQVSDLDVSREESKRRRRMCMVQIVHCLRNGLSGMPKENILFLSASQLQRLVNYIGINNLFKKSKFKLLVVECDSEIDPETVRKINTCVKLILAFNDELRYYPSLKSSFPILLKCDFDMTFDFDNLTELSQKILQRCKVDIQGHTISLGKIEGDSSPCLLDGIDSMALVRQFFAPTSLSPLTASELICNIFDGEGIELVGGTLPNVAVHYITRRFYQITLNISKLKDDLSKDKFSDLIVVSNYEGESIRRSVGVDPKEKIKWREGDYSKVQFQRDYEGSHNAHWFKQVNNELIWQSTKGLPCLDYLEGRTGEIDELDIFNVQTDMIVLADEPGMGKSASIINLFLEHRNLQMGSERPENSSYNLGVYIDLHNHPLDLKDCTYSDALGSQFLTKNMKVQGDVSSKLFPFLMSGHITFFIDSFDEISKSAQDFILKLLKKLKSENNHDLRIVIATRVYAKTELENALETKAYQFHRIPWKEQISFLTNYWTSITFEHHNFVKRLARDFAKRAVNAIKKLLGENDTFIGIPLQLVLLATIHSHGFKQLVKNKFKISETGLVVPTNTDTLRISDNDWENFSHKFSSTLELYDEFVNQKFNIWLDEKLRLERRTVRIDKNEKLRMNDVLSQAAFSNLSSSYFKSLNRPLPIEPPNEEDCEDVNRAGICEAILEWRKTIHIPNILIKRLRKTRNIQNAESMNIVYLTARDNNANNGQVRNLLKDFISAEIRFGNEDKFFELCAEHSSSNVSKQIHWFKEDSHSNFVFQQMFDSRNEIYDLFYPPLISTSYEICHYSYRFIHQTLAEYFMAKCLVSLLEKGDKNKDDTVEFLKVHYHEDYFRKIRYFLDSFLCTDIPALDNLEMFKIPALILNFDKGLSDDYDWKREDSLGRNILHYAVAYGNYLIDGIFWMIAKNFDLFHKKDKLDASCLSYLLLADHLRNTDFAYGYLKLFTKKYLSKWRPVDPKPFHSELFYSMFIGKIYSITSSQCRDFGSFIDDEEREGREIGDASSKKFIEILNRDSSQLTKQLEINIEWILGCPRNMREKIFGILFVHNSQAIDSIELDNLDKWLEYCLDKGTPGGFSLAADLLSAAVPWKNLNKVFNDRICTKIREKLKIYYENMYTYMTGGAANRLLDSCKTDEQKEIVKKIDELYRMQRIESLLLQRR